MDERDNSRYQSVLESYTLYQKDEIDILDVWKGKGRLLDTILDVEKKSDIYKMGTKQELQLQKLREREESWSLSWKKRDPWRSLRRELRNKSAVYTKTYWISSKKFQKIL